MIDFAGGDPSTGTEAATETAAQPTATRSRPRRARSRAPRSALRRRWWVPVLFAQLAVGALFALAWVRGPQFVASGLVELRAPLPEVADPTREAEPPTRAVLETHRRLLESNQVVDDALELLGRLPASLDERPAARAALRGRLKITDSLKTFLVNIQSTASNPDEARLTADAMMSAFVRFTERFLGSSAQRRVVLKDKEAHLTRRLRELMATVTVTPTRAPAATRAPASPGAGAADAAPVGSGAVSELEDVVERWKQLAARIAAIDQEAVEQTALDAQLAAGLARLEQAQPAPAGEGALAGRSPAEDLLHLLEATEEQAVRGRIGALRAKLLHLERTVRPEKLAALPERAQLARELAHELDLVRELVTAAARMAIARSAERQAELARWSKELLARRAELEERLATLAREEQLQLAGGGSLAWYEAELETVRGELHRLETSPPAVGARIVDPAKRPLEPSAPVGPVGGIALIVLSVGLGIALATGWDSLVPPFVPRAELSRLALRDLGRLPPGPPPAEDAARLLATVDPRGQARSLVVTGPAEARVLDGIAHSLALLVAHGGKSAVLGRQHGPTPKIQDAEVAKRVSVRSSRELLKPGAALPVEGARQLLSVPIDRVAAYARRADAILFVVPDGCSRLVTLEALDAVRAAGGRISGVIVAET